MPRKPTFIDRIQRLPSSIRLLSLGLLILLIGVSTWSLLATRHFTLALPQNSATRGISLNVSPQPSQSILKAIQVQVNEPVSPYIFGTNMGLFDANDQLLTSLTARQLMQQIHPTIIRMPARDSLNIATEIQAAQVIKNLGAVPLLVLHGSNDPNQLPLDLALIRAMNQVFGNNTVYYEYGNEEDLHGVPVESYTVSWNTVIPQLAKAALNGRFIGPVNYQYDHNYLATFLRTANPRPDAISWHEYTCDDAQPAATCLAHIANWTSHITDARFSMQQILGLTLPIMITEWNYAPNAFPNDGKNNDSAFMTNWTTSALQTLAANRVFASMQYSCTNTAIPLISPANQMTAQGNALAAQYEQVIVKGQQPLPVAVAMTPTTQATPATGSGNGHGVQGPIAFSFEDGGIDNWSANGQGITNLQNTSTIALDGQHALQITLSNNSTSDFPYIVVDTSSQPNAPQAGQTISAYLYLASNSVSVNARIFVADNNYHWLLQDSVPLSPGAWTHLTYTIPSSLNGNPRQIGIQFNSPTGGSISTNVYLDAVGWQ